MLRARKESKVPPTKFKTACWEKDRRALMKKSKVLIRESNGMNPRLMLSLMIKKRRRKVKICNRPEDLDAISVKKPTTTLMNSLTQLIKRLLETEAKAVAASVSCSHNHIPLKFSKTRQDGSYPKS